jgi:tricorn protease
MKKQNFICFIVVGLILIVSSPSSSLGSNQIHGMRFPELSPDGKMLVFSYQGDLWKVESTGGTASRLTSNQAFEGRSRFSPDGLSIAFESNRYGNYDIFVMPSDGSNDPTRITFASWNENVQGWYPDGKNLLIKYPSWYSIYVMASQDLTGGMPRPIFEDMQDHDSPSITKDGKTLYYLRIPAWVDDWRTGYRGSADGDIWSYDLKTGENKIIYEDDRSQHYLMLGHDETYLVFADYVNQGSSNLIRYDLATGKLHDLTNYRDDTVRNPSMDNSGVIVYEYMNDLYRLEPGKSPVKLDIYASAENKTNDTELKTLTAGAENAVVSPDNRLVAISVEGDIFAYRVDGEVDNKGINLTNSPDAMDSEPVFSEDSKTLFYLENKGNGSRITQIDLKTLKVNYLTDENVIHNLQRIPTTNLLSFIHDEGEIIVFDPTSKKFEPIATLLCYLCNEVYPMSWSPDGNYIAIQDGSGYSNEVYIVDRKTKKTWNISYFYDSDNIPMFSPDGRWLVYRSDRDDRTSIKLIELNPESKLDKTVLIEPEKTEEKTAEESPDAKPEEKKIEVKINFEKIDERARAISTTPGYKTPLGFSLDGEWFFYSDASDQTPVTPPQENLWKVATSAESKDQPQNLGPAPSSLIYSKDAIYAQMEGRIFKFSDAGVGEEIPFTVQRIENFSDQKKLIIRLAALYLKDAFYDRELHGADWDRVTAKYIALAGDARTPEDMQSLLNRINGELNASHLYAYSPSSFKGLPDTTSDLGLEWDPYYNGEGLKVRRVYRDSPADKPDILIKPGDIVLRIDGESVDNRHNPAKVLNNKTNKVVKLAVKDGTTEREVKIRAQNWHLAYLGGYKTWVEENRQMVDKLSNGRLGYVHIEWMGTGPLALFEKEYYNLMMEKEGIIIDVRFNPGGWVHPQLLDILDRKPFGFSVPRGYEGYMPQPGLANRTPSVLLINECSYSDAEIFPYAYKKLKLGKIIGMPTYGAVIGTTEAALPGGYMIRTPCEGWFRSDLGNMENFGEKPDITVPFPPDAVTKGKDPQIERAVEELIKLIDKK